MSLLALEDPLDVLFHPARVRVIAITAGWNSVRTDDLVDAPARLFFILHKGHEVV